MKRRLERDLVRLASGKIEMKEVAKRHRAEVEGVVVLKDRLLRLSREAGEDIGDETNSWNALKARLGESNGARTPALRTRWRRRLVLALAATLASATGAAYAGGVAEVREGVDSIIDKVVELIDDKPVLQPQQVDPAEEDRRGDESRDKETEPGEDGNDADDKEIEDPGKPGHDEPAEELEGDDLEPDEPDEPEENLGGPNPGSD